MPFTTQIREMLALRLRGGERRRSVYRQLTGPQILLGSFLILIGGGTLGFEVLPGLYTGASLGWLDALFTATSAVCVTGLIVVDTATYFTAAGQVYLLLLIQLGGLGMVTIATWIIIALGRRLSLRTEGLAASGAEVAPNIDVKRLALDIVRFTFLLEGIGAVLLYLFWIPQLGAAGAVWPAVFHAVSAFCNAGFSTFSTSLMGFQQSPGVLFVIMALIVAGGIGFLTMEELFRRRRSAVRRRRFSLHSRLALTTTGILIVGGWVLFAYFEWSITLEGLPLVDKLTNALFLSVTPRTAGFNSIDYAQATERTNFLTILLMSIGGSPGSTAGGLKTTTVALIGLMAWSRMQGRELVTLWDRSVPEETVQRSIGLFVLAFGIVTAAIFLLTSTEIENAPHTEVGHLFLAYMFEAASAFNTVGLSMGATGNLTITGKWTLILLMYLGRVGPLTFAAALALKQRVPSRRFRYAYEDTVVG